MGHNGKIVTNNGKTKPHIPYSYEWWLLIKHYPMTYDVIQTLWSTKSHTIPLERPRNLDDIPGKVIIQIISINNTLRTKLTMTLH